MYYSTFTLMKHRIRTVFDFPQNFRKALDYAKNVPNFSCTWVISRNENIPEVFATLSQLISYKCELNGVHYLTIFRHIYKMVGKSSARTANFFTPSLQIAFVFVHVIAGVLLLLSIVYYCSR